MTLRVLTPDEVRSFRYIKKRFDLESPLITVLNKLEVGGGLLVNAEDWKYYTLPRSFIKSYNEHMKKGGERRHYSVYSLQAHKGWVIVRDI